MQLQISSVNVDRCLRALDQPGADREAFRQLVDFYDARVPDDSFLPEVWQRWYEFGHPLHEPYFHESVFNPFVREVADVLFRRMQQAIFEAEER